MKLDEFIKEQKAQLAKFEAYWLEHHTEDPIQFPLTMQAGDWDEQLWIFDRVK